MTDLTQSMSEDERVTKLAHPHAYETPHGWIMAWEDKVPGVAQKNLMPQTRGWAKARQHSTVQSHPAVQAFERSLAASPEQATLERWPVHYDSMPHSCQDPAHCDCNCTGCVKARGHKVEVENGRCICNHAACVICGPRIAKSVLAGEGEGFRSPEQAKEEPIKTCTCVFPNDVPSWLHDSKCYLFVPIMPSPASSEVQPEQQDERRDFSLVRRRALHAAAHAAYEDAKDTCWSQALHDDVLGILPIEHRTNYGLNPTPPPVQQVAGEAQPEPNDDGWNHLYEYARTHDKINGLHGATLFNLITQLRESKAAASPVAEVAAGKEELPPLAERWDRKEDSAGEFMGLIPNGEFVRWHRYQELRSVAESLESQVERLTREKDDLIEKNCEFVKVVDSYALLVETVATHGEKDAARADASERDLSALKESAGQGFDEYLASTEYAGIVDYRTQLLRQGWEARGVGWGRENGIREALNAVTALYSAPCIYESSTDIRMGCISQAEAAIRALLPSAPTTKDGQ